MCAAVLSFYMGLGETNSGPHAAWEALYPRGHGAISLGPGNVYQAWTYHVPRPLRDQECRSEQHSRASSVGSFMRLDNVLALRCHVTNHCLVQQLEHML